MKIFYTGAPSFESVQKIPANSLGGYISSSEVPNALLSNVFDSITKLTISKNKPEYRVLAIYNDSGATLTGLKAHFTYPLSDDSPATDIADAHFKIASATPQVDSCGDLFIDSIGSSNARPYGITFVEADGVLNALSLPDLAASSYLIIYLQRTLDADLQQPLSDEDLLAILNQTLVLSTEEEIELTFSWT